MLKASSRFVSTITPSHNHARHILYVEDMSTDLGLGLTVAKIQQQTYNNQPPLHPPTASIMFLPLLSKWSLAPSLHII